MPGPSSYADLERQGGLQKTFVTSAASLPTRSGGRLRQNACDDPSVRRQRGAEKSDDEALEAREKASRFRE